MLALLGLAACRQAPPPVAPRMHPTIVSLNPCSDAVLAEVTRPGQLLAVSHYSHDPNASSMGVAKGRRYPAVSGSVEEIAALAPDIVVADIFLAPGTAQGLRDLGIEVVTTGSIASIEANEAQVRELAKVAHNIPAGEALVRRIEGALESAAPPPDEAPLTAIVWESGGIVAGDQTLIADLLRRTGFVNAAAARGLGQADFLPLEAMLADPPDVILATGNPRSQEDRLLGHPALAALGDTRREPFDNALLWCGGPTIVRAAARLQQIRHRLSKRPAGPNAAP